MTYLHFVVVIFFRCKRGKGQSNNINTGNNRVEPDGIDNETALSREHGHAMPLQTMGNTDLIPRPEAVSSSFSIQRPSSLESEETRNTIVYEVPLETDTANNNRRPETTQSPIFIQRPSPYQPVESAQASQTRHYDTVPLDTDTANNNPRYDAQS